MGPARIPGVPNEIAEGLSPGDLDEVLRMTFATGAGDVLRFERIISDVDMVAVEVGLDRGFPTED